MSIFDRLRDGEAAARAEIHGKDLYGPDLGATMESYFAGGSAWGTSRSKGRLLRAALGWVYASANAIADGIAQADLRLVRVAPDGTKEEVYDHPALDVIAKPNSGMTRFDLMQLVGQYLELTGEAPWYVSRNRQGVQGIYALRPDRLTVEPGKNGEPVGGYTYQVYDQGGSATQLELDVDEVVFLKYTDPDNPSRGKGPLQAAASAVDLDVYAEAYNTRFFRNSAQPDSVLTFEKTLATEVRKRLEAKLREKYQGVDNSHKTMILEGGGKFDRLSISQKDMDFLEQQKFSRDKILAIFRTPKTVVAVTEDVNRANAETGEYVFAKWTILPKLRRIEEQLNHFFLPMFPGTDDLYFEFANPVPEDRSQLVNEANAGVTNGYLSPNEARALLGFDEVEGGDELRAPQTFAQTGLRAAKRGKPRATAAQKLLAAADRRPREAARKRALFIARTVRAVVFPIVRAYLAQKRAQAAKVRDVEAVPKSLFAGSADESKAAKLAFQTRQLALADEHEPSVERAMAKMFREQRDLVLRGVDAGEKTLLKVDPETDRFARLFAPPMARLLRAQGREAFQLVGVAKTAKAATFTETLAQYLEARTYELAPPITRETNDKLRKLFADAARNESSIPAIKRAVREIFNGMAGYRAERIARTEVIDGSNFASQAAWGESGVVEKKEWLATRDERTDDECAEHDGEVVPLNGKFRGGIAYPPLHPNCRCTILPVVYAPGQGPAARG